MNMQDDRPNKLEELLSVNALIHWLRWVAGFDVLSFAQYIMGIDISVGESTTCYSFAYGYDTREVWSDSDGDVFMPDARKMIGKVLHGNCNGFFGHDSYGPKTIEAVGPDWAVAREEDGTVALAIFPGTLRPLLNTLLEVWQIEDMSEEEMEQYEKGGNKL